MKTVQPGDRVESVYQIRTFGGTLKTMRRPGTVLGMDPDDPERALVQFDGEGEHVSHPLLEILEPE